MSRNPTDLRVASAAIVAATGSTDLIANPGLGYRYRLWAWSCSMRETATGSYRCRLGYQSGALVIVLYSALSVNQRMFYEAIPGGLAWDENQEFRLNLTPSGAAQDIDAFVLYTIESV